MPDACVRVAVRPDLYADSVTLLHVTSAVKGLSGVQEAAIVVGTPVNRELLERLDLLQDEVPSGPNDLVMAVRADDAASAEAALRQAEALLARGVSAPLSGGEVAARSLRSARQRLPEAKLAVISVPGPYAAAEAHQALSDGLHVFLFSDNVPMDEEVRLKERARQQGLLLMGPDCGTAILGGVGLGFANMVRRGRVGLVGASGTGLQELSVLLHQAGEGISQAIGTGSRDLRAEVGGVTTLQALELLADDPETERIVLVSKPPDPEVASAVLEAAATTGKPVVACLLGVPVAAPPGVVVVDTLEEAAGWTPSGQGGMPHWSVRPQPWLGHASPPVGSRAPVLGLYCGGTLAEEARLVLGGGTFVDLGDDRYTQGRAHPIIDPTLRTRAIREAGADPSVEVLLLDVILGFAAHPDPASVIAPAVRESIQRAAEDGRHLSVLAHIVGTDGDPQGLDQQVATLRAAGVELQPSNAALARRLPSISSR